MVSTSHFDARAFMLDVAARADSLVVVGAAAAEEARAEWRVILRSFCESKPLRLVGAKAPRLSRPPLAAELPPAGTWIRFRPHVSSDWMVFLVLGFVPVGHAIDRYLTQAQLRLLQDGIRSRCYHGDRVILGEPGGSNLIASIRTSLAGAVAARCEIIEAPDFVTERRKAEPLPAGAHVSWAWHSSYGPSIKAGVVLAYIPAGAQVDTVCPAAPKSCRVRPMSDQDRYLVQIEGCAKPTYRTPPAFLVEGSCERLAES